MVDEDECKNEMSDTHKIKKEKDLSEATSEGKKHEILARVRLIMCMDYIVNNIINYGDYDFKHAWNLTAVPNSPMRLVELLPEHLLLRYSFPGIEDDDSFESIMGMGVQAIAHAVYPNDWERIGPFLHRMQKVFVMNKENKQ